MRLVKISLGPDNPFWFLGRINLTEKKKETDYVDVDSLTDDDRRIINDSAKMRSIRLVDITGQRISSIDECTLSNTSFVVETTDLEEDILLPEIATVTINEDVKPPTSPVSLEEPTEIDVKDARILIRRKGNTIKKMISEMTPNQKNLMILMAAEEVEKTEKNRDGILLYIRETIERWQDGRNS